MTDPDPLVLSAMNVFQGCGRSLPPLQRARIKSLPEIGTVVGVPVHYADYRKLF